MEAGTVGLEEMADDSTYIHPNAISFFLKESTV